MTDVFNIDQESEGFRRNNLDWRKLREKYNHIAVSKLERGITPLPTALVLKLFGPRKVLDTFVVSRRQTATAQQAECVQCGGTDARFELDMRDKKVAKPLNFPADSILRRESEENGYHVNPKVVVKGNKHAALPLRPVFQRSMHVPGRYFPKPTPTEEQREFPVSRPVSEYPAGERPRTQTPRSAYTPHSRGSSKTTGSSGKPSTASLKKFSGFRRGPVCQATETSHKGVVLSGRTIGTPKTPSVISGETVPDRKSGDLFSISFRNFEQRENGSNGSQSEFYSDHYGIKKVRLSARQVSFPGRGSDDFSTVLQGRPKTLHARKDGVDSSYGSHVTDTSKLNGRAKTHVGFTENER